MDFSFSVVDPEGVQGANPTSVVDPEGVQGANPTLRQFFKIFMESFQKTGKLINNQVQLTKQKPLCKFW